MKKRLIVIFLITFVCFGLLAGVFHVLSNSHYLVEKQKTQVADFFSSNRASLESIYIALNKSNLSIKTIEDDGTIELQDATRVRLDNVSELIKSVYTEGKKYHIRNIEYITETNVFFVESYFPINRTIIRLIYSDDGLMLDDTEVTHLDSNWYLQVLYMT